MIPVKHWTVGEPCRFIYSKSLKRTVYKTGVIVRQLHNLPYGTIYRQFMVKMDDSDLVFQIDEPRLLLPEEQGETDDGLSE